MRKIILLISLVLFTFTFDVKAIDDCTTGELSRLKELAGNVSFTYDYYFNEVEDDSEGETVFGSLYYYNITAHNLHDDLKVQIKETHARFTTIRPTLTSFTSGEIVKIEILAYTENLCSGKLLKLETIKLPYFNEYSLRDECKQYSEFKYCQEFGSFDVDDEKFLSELENYKKELIQNNQPNDNNFQIFFANYGVYVITIIFLITISIITFIIIKIIKKKDSDLS